MHRFEGSCKNPQRAIVVELARKGFTTRKGTALSLVQVQRIMHQAAIA